MQLQLVRQNKISLQYPLRFSSCFVILAHILPYKVAHWRIGLRFFVLARALTFQLTLWCLARSSIIQTFYDFFRERQLLLCYGDEFYSNKIIVLSSLQLFLNKLTANSLVVDILSLFNTNLGGIVVFGIFVTSSNVGQVSCRLQRKNELSQT